MKNYRVNGVESQLTAIGEKKDGNHQTYKLPYIDKTTSWHIQGYTQDNKQSFFTRSYKPYSFLLCGNKTWKIELSAPGEGYWHAGGIQMLGKYLFIPFEGKIDGSYKSKILVYNTETDSWPTLKNQSILEFSHEAHCVGITDFESNIDISTKAKFIDDKFRPYCLMIVGDGKKYHAFVAKTHKIENGIETEIAIEDIEFISFGEFDYKYDCQGIGLVTDENGTIYMLALYSHDYVRNWAYLLKIEPDMYKREIKYTNIKEVRLVDVGDGGSHFRWAGGVRVTPDKRLVILATSRNITKDGILNTNYWCI